MIRTLAPSGNPVRLVELFECISRVRQEPALELNTGIQSCLDVNNSFLVSTGRAAMTMLLRAMVRLQPNPERNIVVVPSYTCYSVAASAIKAGLTVLACDIDKTSLSYDEEQLASVDFDRVLAIVSCNLYGIPDDLWRLEDFAKEHGVFLVDDAAQSLGATVKGRAVGSFGDAGILSFDKGKVITTINGGAIVTRSSELAHEIQTEYNNVAEQSWIDRTTDVAKLLGYSVLLRPAFYWIPSRLPFLRLGETRYDDEYPVKRYFDSLAPLATIQLSRLEETNQHRRRCASRYSEILGGVSAVEHIQPTPGSQPVFLRYPIRILDPDLRRRFLDSGKRLGVSVSYPAAIADIPQIRDQVLVQNGTCETGREIAMQLVTLPTHPYVRDSDIERVCTELKR